METNSAINLDKFVWTLRQLIKNAYPGGLPIHQLESACKTYFPDLHVPTPDAINPNYCSWPDVLTKCGQLKEWFFINEKNEIRVKEKPEPDLLTYFKLNTYENFSFLRNQAMLEVDEVENNQTVPNLPKKKDEILYLATDEAGASRRSLPDQDPNTPVLKIRRLEDLLDPETTEAGAGTSNTETTIAIDPNLTHETDGPSNADEISGSDPDLQDLYDGFQIIEEVEDDMPEEAHQPPPKTARVAVNTDKASERTEIKYKTPKSTKALTSRLAKSKISSPQPHTSPKPVSTSTSGHSNEKTDRMGTKIRTSTSSRRPSDEFGRNEQQLKPRNTTERKSTIIKTSISSGARKKEPLLPTPPAPGPPLYTHLIRETRLKAEWARREVLNLFKPRSCGLCGIDRLNNEESARFHYRGFKHAKKLQQFLRFLETKGVTTLTHEELVYTSYMDYELDDFEEEGEEGPPLQLTSYTELLPKLMEMDTRTVQVHDDPLTMTGYHSTWEQDCWTMWLEVKQCVNSENLRWCRNLPNYPTLFSHHFTEIGQKLQDGHYTSPVEFREDMRQVLQFYRSLEVGPSDREYLEVQTIREIFHFKLRGVINEYQTHSLQV